MKKKYQFYYYHFCLSVLIIYLLKNTNEKVKTEKTCIKTEKVCDSEKRNKIL